jgi:hypothetical protein
MWRGQVSANEISDGSSKKVAMYWMSPKESSLSLEFSIERGQDRDLGFDPPARKPMVAFQIELTIRNFGVVVV